MSWATGLLGAGFDGAVGILNGYSSAILSEELQMRGLGVVGGSEESGFSRMCGVPGTSLSAWRSSISIRWRGRAFWSGSVCQNELCICIYNRDQPLRCDRLDSVNVRSIDSII